MSLVLVTGARGFIGRHLALELYRGGHQVVGLGHGGWPAKEARKWGIVAWRNGDVNAANLRQLRLEVGVPDVIYHLAGGSSVSAALAAPLEDFSRTVASTAELLDWMRLDSPSSLLIAVSSAAVYGDGHSGPIGENSAIRPYSAYGCHKRLMEELCLSYAESFGVRLSIARLFSVYGPELRKQLLWDVCGRLESLEDPLELGGSGSELRDWTHVEDVASALRHIGTAVGSPGLITNVGTGLGTSVRGVADLVLRAWNPPHTVPEVRFSGKARPGDPFSLVADVTQLGNLGLRCGRGITEGSVEYVSWFKGRPRE